MPANAVRGSRSILESDQLLLRINVAMHITGLGRSTIYRLMADRQFPIPVRLSKRVVAWRRSDLERWSEGRPAAAH
jgi:prophage regulatory protein